MAISSYQYAEIPAPTRRDRMFMAFTLAAQHSPRWALSLARRTKLALRRQQARSKYVVAIQQATADMEHADVRLLAVTGATAVFRIEPLSGPVAILKAARTPQATEQLQREADVLIELGRLAASTGQRHKIATILDRGSGESIAWFTQTPLPGSQPMFDALDGSSIVVAVEALRPIHDLATHRAPVTATNLTALVNAPVESITACRPEQAAGLDMISRWLSDRISDRPLSLCRIHGDYAPANVLAEPGSDDITGIIDWTFEATLLPPEIDLVHYAISGLAASRDEEYGQTVTWLLTAEPDEHEIRPVLTALACGPNQFDLQTGITLAWLHHVAHGLTRSEELKWNPVWVNNNLAHVLDTMRKSLTEHPDQHPENRPTLAAVACG